MQEQTLLHPQYCQPHHNAKPNNTNKIYFLCFVGAFCVFCACGVFLMGFVVIVVVTAVVIVFGFNHWRRRRHHLHRRRVY